MIEIRPGDLSGPEVRALLREHLRDMVEVTPPESVHALDLEGLAHPSVTMWTAWSRGELLGCGALREIDPRHGEIKSMRTARAHRRKGVARVVLEHIVGQARARGYRQLSLETGAMPAFEAARRLYADFGFTACGPFGDYAPDPNSVFMTLDLSAR